MSASRLLHAMLCTFLFGTAAVHAGEGAPRAAAEGPGGALLVKPYLQLGGTPAPGSVTVLWHAADADADASWSFEYRAGADRPWEKAPAPTSRRVAVEGTEPHRVYRAALTGLEPGALFRYRVRNGDAVVFEADARAQKSADQPYRFVAFGDLGAGTPEQKPMALRAFLSKPDFVVVPGDIVYDRGQIADYREKFWPRS
jgi:phosphodiesterase/alkaline phosphatase D-like protein